MKNELNKNKSGLALGLLFAVLHAIWSLFVVLIPQGLQNFLNWIFELHCLKPVLIIMPFNFVNVLLLIVITFVFGYIFGWIFALLWNVLHKN